MEYKPEILDLYELQYSDLILLSSDPVTVSPYSLEEMQRVESITSAIMETLGPSGPGLLSITGVPNISSLRSQLLPLARKLALLNREDRKRILKEHSLGSDVPLKNLERSVSSFAMQLKYVQDLGVSRDEVDHVADENHKVKGSKIDNVSLGSFQDNDFKDLGCMFKKLGICMMELGIRLARICDRAIGGQELEQSLLESCAAKGRLIHYHSTLDNNILKEVGRRRSSTTGLANCINNRKKSLRIEQPPELALNSRTCGTQICSSENSSNLWQQWHYDYGVFTVLTDPLFISSHHLQAMAEKEISFLSCEQECPSPSGHTCLQIYNPRRNMVQMVKSSPKSFMVQVGESADILSKGKICATLHSVCRPKDLGDLSRETFVVFLQPAWSKTFTISDYPTEQLTEDGEFRDIPRQEFRKMIPPLSSRLKDGMTFAEFSHETTKKYYGGSGLQSNR